MYYFFEYYRSKAAGYYTQKNNKMKKILLALMLLAIVAACTQKTEPRYCTEDAKLCPDGSYVGRDSANNCEFRECPSTDDKPIPVEPDGGIGMTNPYVKYASTDKEE